MASKAIALLGVVLSLAGCTTIKGKVPVHHIVMFNEDGRPVDPTGNYGCEGKPPCNAGESPTMLWFADYPVLGKEEFHSYVAEIFENMRGYFRDREAGHTQTSKTPEPKADPDAARGPVKKILLFVHGGLNKTVGSIQRAVDLNEKIREAGYYPIFVNWNSSLWSSYSEHLFHIRQGEKWQWAGYATFPIYLGLDLVRSVVRIPLVWTYQLSNDLKTVPAIARRVDPQDANKVAMDLLCPRPDTSGCREAYKLRELPLCFPFRVGGSENMRWRGKDRFTADPVRFSMGDDFRECTEMNKAFASWVLTQPAKLLIGPVLDVAGTSAWNNMIRRTHMLFHLDEEFHASSDETRASVSSGSVDNDRKRGEGGLAIFLESLASEIESEKKKGQTRWEITVVGHSMGTLVVNELLRTFGNLADCAEDVAGGCGTRRLPITDIVYMAAASSIEDYETSVLPYLRNNSDATFYNLLLHREAEVGERIQPILDPAPRGSVLVWIDNFFSTPLTHRDRTLGRFDNFMVALHDTPKDLQKRIRIKVFSAGEARSDSSPQKHAHFTEIFKFWEKTCWEPKEKIESDCLTIAP